MGKDGVRNADRLETQQNKHRVKECIWGYTNKEGKKESTQKDQINEDIIKKQQKKEMKQKRNLTKEQRSVKIQVEEEYYEEKEEQKSQINNQLKPKDIKNENTTKKNKKVDIQIVKGVEETHAERSEELFEGMYQVEKIKKINVVGKFKLRFYIKWKGWGQDENTWEPFQHLKLCFPILKKFYESEVKKNLILQTQAWKLFEGCLIKEGLLDEEKNFIDWTKRKKYHWQKEENEELEKLDNSIQEVQEQINDHENNYQEQIISENEIINEKVKKQSSSKKQDDEVKEDNGKLYRNKKICKRILQQRATSKLIHQQKKVKINHLILDQVSLKLMKSKLIGINPNDNLKSTKDQSNQQQNRSIHNQIIEEVDEEDDEELFDPNLKSSEKKKNKDQNHLIHQRKDPLKINQNQHLLEESKLNNSLLSEMKGKFVDIDQSSFSEAIQFFIPNQIFPQQSQQTEYVEQQKYDSPPNQLLQQQEQKQQEQQEQQQQLKQQQMQEKKQQEQQQQQQQQLEMQKQQEQQKQQQQQLEKQQQQQLEKQQEQLLIQEQQQQQQLLKKQQQQFQEQQEMQKQQQQLQKQQQQQQQILQQQQQYEQEKKQLLSMQEQREQSQLLFQQQEQQQQQKDKQQQQLQQQQLQKEKSEQLLKEKQQQQLQEQQQQEQQQQKKKQMQNQEQIAQQKQQQRQMQKQQEEQSQLEQKLKRKQEQQQQEFFINSKLNHSISNLNKKNIIDPFFKQQYLSTFNQLEAEEDEDYEEEEDEEEGQENRQIMRRQFNQVKSKELKTYSNNRVIEQDYKKSIQKSCQMPNYIDLEDDNQFQNIQENEEDEASFLRAQMTPDIVEIDDDCDEVLENQEEEEEVVAENKRQAIIKYTKNKKQKIKLDANRGFSRRLSISDSIEVISISDSIEIMEESITEQEVLSNSQNEIIDPVYPQQEFINYFDVSQHQQQMLQQESLYNQQIEQQKQNQLIQQQLEQNFLNLEEFEQNQSKYSKSSKSLESSENSELSQESQQNESIPEQEEKPIEPQFLQPLMIKLPLSFLLQQEEQTQQQLLQELEDKQQQQIFQNKQIQLQQQKILEKEYEQRKHLENFLVQDEDKQVKSLFQGNLNLFDKPQGILQIDMHPFIIDEYIFKVKWKKNEEEHQKEQQCSIESDSKVAWVEGSKLRQRYPQMLIEFYERYLKFVD